MPRTVVDVLSLSLSIPPEQMQFVGKVLELSRNEIHHIHHGVRVECLKLIGLLSHVIDDTEVSLSILEDNCHDGDPRVRTAAFQALVRRNWSKGYCNHTSVSIAIRNCTYDHNVYI